MSDNPENPSAPPPPDPERFEAPEPAEPRAPVEHHVPDMRLAEGDPQQTPDPLLPSDPAATGGAPNDRLALDGTSLWLNRLGEELVAWLKTLASAAVYATLIVTFGFQVARVEGMSMAPTLQDQDRLIRSEERRVG